jgi:cyclase
MQLRASPGPKCAALLMLAVSLGTSDVANDVWAQSVQHSEIEVLPVQGNVYVLAGSDGNITLHVGQDGVLLVDAGVTAVTDKVLAEIKKLSSKPIRYIINTHVHSDHIAGNARLAEAGLRFGGAGGAGGPGASLLTNVGTGAIVLAHENVLKRMSAPTARQSTVPFALWPSDTFFGKRKAFSFNAEPIEILLQPDAHTDGDVIVFFRKSDVISTGDVYVTTSYPVIDTQRGGSLQGVINAINRIIVITIPQFNQRGGTRVIPGHGRISNEADVVEYRDMVTIIRDRVSDMVQKKMSLSQVRAARPTLDYDELYNTPEWTADMFIESVYRELSETANTTASRRKE